MPRSQPFRRLLAFSFAVKRDIGCEPFGDAHDLLAESLELQLDRLILNAALIVEDARGRRNRHDIRHRPTPKRPDRELHRVYRLQPLRPPGGADQADHLVVEEGWFSAA